MTPEPSQQPERDAEIARLLERHVPSLRAFVRVRMGPMIAARESSTDIVQSVCRELLSQRSGVKFDGEAAFRSWLYSAAHHKILQMARRHTAAKRDVNREAADPALLDHYSTLVTPSRDASAREQVERLESALSRLPDDDREIIALKKIAGIPHEQIAKLTDRSVEACRAKLRRALVRLSALLEPEIGH